MALPHSALSQLRQRLESEPEPLCQPGSGDDLAGQVKRTDKARSAAAQPSFAGRWRMCSAVEPGVFHPPLVVRAVDPDRDSPDPRIRASHRARMENDRPAAILSQIFFD